MFFNLLVQICDVISKWEQALKELHPGKYEGTRIVCLTFKSRELSERLATKWSVLHGCTASECVRVYLTVARKWPLFGAKLFSAKPLPPSSLEQTGVWLAVNEDGLNVLDYTMSVITFGGCKEDFMLVVSQIKDQALGSKIGDKLLYAMTKPKILELTLLMACYINYWTSSLPGARSQNQVSAVSLMETGSSGTSTATTSTSLSFKPQSPGVWVGNLSHGLQTNKNTFF